MGKFDLDDLLNDVDLGETGAFEAEGVPASNGRKKQAAPAAAPARPPLPKEDRATIPADKQMFVRTDPREIPRPPDFSGKGLGEEITGSRPRRSDPTRVRPDDALSEIYRPETAATGGEIMRGDSLGEILINRGEITAEQLASAERVLKQAPGKRLAQVLIEMGINEIAVQQVTADLNHLRFERISVDVPESYDEKMLHRLTPEFCKNNFVVPLRKEGSRVVVGTISPDDVFVLDDVKRRLGVPSIKHVLVTAGDITALLEKKSEAEAGDYSVDQLLADVEEDDVEVVRDDNVEENFEDADSSPVVRYVNHIIQTAVKEGASDIHIEPDDRSLKVRFRIDGVLFEMMNPPKKMHAALTSRIKIMANLDIAERRLPQDGRIRATVVGRKLDLRVSTVPTPKGEKTVMRILDNRSINVSLDELGFGEDTLMIWKNQISQPHGIILVTGPTGSGKTTTLYASLRQMDLSRLNVSTVEDPVEYNLSRVTQIQTHERIGMNFAKALKALLRQDPDVIMVGEIRDLETATTATQAAMTGHLVLSTLHTNDAPASLTRLINIGIEPFLVGAAVNAVLAQRLVRRICEHCKHRVPIKPDLAEFLSMHGISADHVHEGRGCERCRETGYAGRNGLYEMLVLDDFLRDAVARSPNVTEFRRFCKERGMVSLREDGFQKVAKGMTTVEEVLRVTESTI